MCVVSLLNADEYSLYPCAVGVFAISWSVAENIRLCRGEVGLYKSSSALRVDGLHVPSTL